tara:strand:+ start:1521 stop:1715 length:195 start_codon:yes stop_codon:yes gene_type:complete
MSIVNGQYDRSENGVGLVNTDSSAYKSAIARRKQDKYMKGLEKRLENLESALDLLQKTVKEITK